MAKAELKTKVTKQSADTFINKIPDKQMREDCQQLVTMMKQVTKAEPVMWGPSIVGFGNWTYKYESGREGDWFIMGFSPRKQNLSLYIMPGLDDFENELSKLGTFKTGQACLYVKRLDDIDSKVLRQIMTRAVKSVKTTEKRMHAAPAKKKSSRTAGKKKAKRKTVRRK